MSATSFLRHYLLPLLAGGVLAGGMAHANEPAPAPASSSTGTKIIFSGAKSNAVSANPNELRNPARPFDKLESGLKKPFEVFDPVGRSDVRPARTPVTAPQTPPKRTLAEQWNERAEAMFLNPELYRDKNADLELFGLTEEDVDPYKAAPRNALDRYQDRMERERPALTNNARSPDLFGETPTGLDRSSGFSLDPKPLSNKDGGTTAPNRLNPQSLFSNPAENEATPTGRPLPRSFDSDYPGNSDSFLQRRATAVEMRRENYQRLLNDPSYARHNTGAASVDANAYNPNGHHTPNPYPSGATTRSAPVTPTPAWNATRPAAVSGLNSGNASFSDVAGLTGVPGEPKALPEYSVSATFTEMNATRPQAQPIVPDPIRSTRPTKFQIPQRTY